MALPPLPNVPYHLQNSNFAKFIETSKAEDGSPVILRAMKGAEKQQWIFCPTLMAGTFKIRNVAMTSSLNSEALYLCAKADTPTSTSALCVMTNLSHATSWKFEKGPDGNAILYVSDHKGKKRILRGNGNAKITISNVNDGDLDDTFKWMISPVWPCLSAFQLEMTRNAEALTLSSLSNVHYRLQNSDSATFIEASKAEEGSPIILRPKDAEKQQWFFCPTLTTGMFKIRNVPMTMSANSEVLYLCMKADTPRSVLWVTTNLSLATSWKFEAGPEEDNVTFYVSDHNGKTRMLHPHENTKMMISSVNDGHLEDAFKWTISAGPIIPKAVFRIENDAKNKKKRRRRRRGRGDKGGRQSEDEASELDMSGNEDDASTDESSGDTDKEIDLFSALLKTEVIPGTKHRAQRHKRRRGGRGSATKDHEEVADESQVVAENEQKRRHRGHNQGTKGGRQGSSKNEREEDLGTDEESHPDIDGVRWGKREYGKVRQDLPAAIISTKSGDPVDDAKPCPPFFAVETYPTSPLAHQDIAPKTGGTLRTQLLALAASATTVSSPQDTPQGDKQDAGHISDASPSVVLSKPVGRGPEDDGKELGKTSSATPRAPPVKTTVPSANTVQASLGASIRSSLLLPSSSSRPIPVSPLLPTTKPGPGPSAQETTGGSGRAATTVHLTDSEKLPETYAGSPSVSESAAHVQHQPTQTVRTNQAPSPSTAPWSSPIRLRSFTPISSIINSTTKAAASNEVPSSSPAASTSPTYPSSIISAPPALKSPTQVVTNTLGSSPSLASPTFPIRPNSFLPVPLTVKPSPARTSVPEELQTQMKGQDDGKMSGAARAGGEKSPPVNRDAYLPGSSPAAKVPPKSAVVAKPERPSNSLTRHDSSLPHSALSPSKSSNTASPTRGSGSVARYLSFVKSTTPVKRPSGPIGHSSDAPCATLAPSLLVQPKPPSPTVKATQSSASPSQFNSPTRSTTSEISLTQQPLQAIVSPDDTPTSAAPMSSFLTLSTQSTSLSPTHPKPSPPSVLSSPTSSQFTSPVQLTKPGASNAQQPPQALVSPDDTPTSAASTSSLTSSTLSTASASHSSDAPSAVSTLSSSTHSISSLPTSKKTFSSPTRNQFTCPVQSTMPGISQTQQSPHAIISTHDTPTPAASKPSSLTRLTPSTSFSPTYKSASSPFTRSTLATWQPSQSTNSPTSTTAALTPSASNGQNPSLSLSPKTRSSPVPMVGKYGEKDLNDPVKPTVIPAGEKLVQVDQPAIIPSSLGYPAKLSPASMSSSPTPAALGKPLGTAQATSALPPPLNTTRPPPSSSVKEPGRNIRESKKDDASTSSPGGKLGAVGNGRAIAIDKSAKSGSSLPPADASNNPLPVSTTTQGPSRSGRVELATAPNSTSAPLLPGILPSPNSSGEPRVDSNSNLKPVVGLSKEQMVVADIPGSVTAMASLSSQIAQSVGLLVKGLNSGIPPPDLPASSTSTLPLKHAPPVSTTLSQRFSTSTSSAAKLATESSPVYPPPIAPCDNPVASSQLVARKPAHPPSTRRPTDLSAKDAITSQRAEQEHDTSVSTLLKREMPEQSSTDLPIPSPSSSSMESKTVQAPVSDAPLESNRSAMNRNTQTSGAGTPLSNTIPTISAPSDSKASITSATSPTPTTAPTLPVHPTSAKSSSPMTQPAPPMPALPGASATPMLNRTAKLTEAAPNPSVGSNPDALAPSTHPEPLSSVSTPTLDAQMKDVSAKFRAKRPADSGPEKSDMSVGKDTQGANQTQSHGGTGDVPSSIKKHDPVPSAASSSPSTSAKCTPSAPAPSSLSSTSPATRAASGSSPSSSLPTPTRPTKTSSELTRAGALSTAPPSLNWSRSDVSARVAPASIKESDVFPFPASSPSTVDSLSSSDFDIGSQSPKPTSRYPPASNEYASGTNLPNSGSDTVQTEAASSPTMDSEPRTSDRPSHPSPLSSLSTSTLEAQTKDISGKVIAEQPMDNRPKKSDVSLGTDATQGANAAQSHVDTGDILGSIQKPDTAPSATSGSPPPSIPPAKQLASMPMPVSSSSSPPPIQPVKTLSKRRRTNTPTAATSANSTHSDGVSCGAGAPASIKNFDADISPVSPKFFGSRLNSRSAHQANRYLVISGSDTDDDDFEYRSSSSSSSPTSTQPINNPSEPGAIDSLIAPPSAKSVGLDDSTHGTPASIKKPDAVSSPSLELSSSRSSSPTNRSDHSAAMSGLDTNDDGFEFGTLPSSSSPISKEPVKTSSEPRGIDSVPPSANSDDVPASIENSLPFPSSSPMSKEPVKTSSELGRIDSVSPSARLDDVLASIENSLPSSDSRSSNAADRSPHDAKIPDAETAGNDDEEDSEEELEEEMDTEDDKDTDDDDEDTNGDDKDKDDEGVAERQDKMDVIQDAKKDEVDSKKDWDDDDDDDEYDTDDFEENSDAPRPKVIQSVGYEETPITKQQVEKIVLQILARLGISP